MATKNHPQTDGQTENANGVLENALRHFVSPFQKDREVDIMSDTRYKGKRTQYRVHWAGYRDQDTWEPLRNLVKITVTDARLYLQHPMGIPCVLCHVTL